MIAIARVMIFICYVFRIIQTQSSDWKLQKFQDYPELPLLQGEFLWYVSKAKTVAVLLEYQKR